MQNDDKGLVFAIFAFLIFGGIIGLSASKLLHSSNHAESQIVDNNQQNNTDQSIKEMERGLDPFGINSPSEASTNETTSSNQTSENQPPSKSFTLTNYWSTDPYCRIQEFTSQDGDKRYAAFVIGKKNNTVSLIKTKTGRKYASLQGNLNELPLTLPYPKTLYPNKGKSKLSIARIYVVPDNTDKTFEDFWGIRLFGEFDVSSQRWRETLNREWIVF